MTNKNMAETVENAIRKFNNDMNRYTFSEVLMALRDSCLIVPCTAKIGEKDMERWMKAIEEAGDDIGSLVGQEFVSEEEIHFSPDILQNGDQFFFPCFTSVEAMGEYGEHFSKLEQPMTDIITMALGYADVAGIVINAFSEPFVVEKAFYDILMTKNEEQ